MYYVYILKCRDQTLYCGVAKNLEKRVKEHNGLLKGGAKYTRGRRPVTLVYSESFETLSEALKKEAFIKRLKRSKKWDLVRFNSRNR